VTTDRYSGPIGRLSKCTANGACSLLATITFLGEQLDTTDPPSRRDGKWPSLSQRPRAEQIAGSACAGSRKDGRVERHYAWLLVGRPASDFCARSVRPGRSDLRTRDHAELWEPLIWRTRALISSCGPTARMERSGQLAGVSRRSSTVPGTRTRWHRFLLQAEDPAHVSAPPPTEPD
jgi:hypothetical protein